MPLSIRFYIALASLVPGAFYWLLGYEFNERGVGLAWTFLFSIIVMIAGIGMYHTFKPSPPFDR